MSIGNQFLARFQDEATLVAPGRQSWFEACLQSTAAELTRVTAQAQAANENLSAEDDDWWGVPGSFKAYLRPYVIRDGILQIPIKGVLLHDFPYALGGWATGYDYIWRAFQRGMGDLNVKGIALVVDSPGGMVAGCFECADKMYALRGTKPIRGYASESAYSAAYALISVVDPGEITVTKTGGVGSIGVVTSHLDISGSMEQRGYKLTFIHAGAHKVDGNAYEALPADVKARIQARIDYIYSIFVSSVARNRGMDEDAVRGTEALCYGAPDALTIGLADKIGALDDALADFSASLTVDEGNENMVDLTQADVDTARAEGQTSGHATGHAAGLSEGATAERSRISSILASEPAKDRPKAALSTALRSNMSLEDATAFLADLPVEKAEAPAPAATVTGAGAPAGMLDAAMDKSDNPELNAEGAATGDEAATASKIDGVFNLLGKKNAA